jgi:hypothetical protein
VTTTDLTGIEATLDRYVSVWNEPHVERRRALIAELWAPDAVYANAATAYRGHEEIAVGVSRSHDRWVGSGHRFAAAGVAGAHHDVARFVWHMFGPGGGEPVSVGTNFITFDDAGRIVADMQFIDR